MLWRFGLGPRPKDMDPAILTLNMLDQVRPFVVLTEGTSSVAATQTSKGETITAPTNAEEVEEEEDVGLQRRKSKQPRSEPDKGAPLNIPPSAKFLFYLPLVSPIFIGIAFFLLGDRPHASSLTHSLCLVQVGLWWSAQKG